MAAKAQAVSDSNRKEITQESTGCPSADIYKVYSGQEHLLSMLTVPTKMLLAAVITSAVLLTDVWLVLAMCFLVRIQQEVLQD